MADWFTNYRSMMLDEVLRRDGLGDSTVLEICVGCMKVVGEIQVQGLHGRQHVLLRVYCLVPLSIPTTQTSGTPQSVRVPAISQTETLKCYALKKAVAHPDLGLKYL